MIERITSYARTLPDKIKAANPRQLLIVAIIIVGIMGLMASVWNVVLMPAVAALVIAWAHLPEKQA